MNRPRGADGGSQRGMFTGSECNGIAGAYVKRRLNGMNGNVVRSL